MTSAEIPGVKMVGHDRASVRRDKVAMSDAGQGEMKTQPHKQPCQPLSRLRLDSLLHRTNVKPAPESEIAKCESFKEVLAFSRSLLCTGGLLWLALRKVSICPRGVDVIL